MTPFLNRIRGTSLLRPVAAATLLAAGCVFFLPRASLAQTVPSIADDDDSDMADIPPVPPTTPTTTTSASTTAVTSVAGTTAFPAPNARIGTTGSISTDTGEPLLNDPAIDEDLARTNLREQTVDGLKSQLDLNRNDAPGIRLGSFVLKPTLGETVNFESNRTGKSKENRSYLETGLKGTLTSDWSRHELSITGDGTWQRNLSGSGETEPTADIQAALRLDLSEQTTATLKAGYHFEREDTTDPNAIIGAKSQSDVDQYSLGAGISRDFGLLRGSAKVDFDRYVYSGTELANGSTLSGKDRNRNAIVGTGRIGYELSPALIPFLEASVGKSVYDLRQDTLGFKRSYDSYGARTGVEVNLGQKLSGEVALGYETFRFEDSRLDNLNGLTLDGLINWSPQRGTDVTFGLSTGLEPSTTSGESGALAYTLSSKVTHQLRSALVARLSNSLTVRNYPSGSTSQDERVWSTGAGLTWDVNRTLALTGDVSYEHSTRETGSANNIARIGIGLTLRR